MARNSDMARIVDMTRSLLAVEALEPRLALTATADPPTQAPPPDDAARPSEANIARLLQETVVDRQGPSVVSVGELRVDPAGKVALDVTFDEDVRFRGRPYFLYVLAGVRRKLVAEREPVEPESIKSASAQAGSASSGGRTIKFADKWGRDRIIPMNASSASLLPDTSITFPRGSWIRDMAGNRPRRADITKERVGDQSFTVMKVDGTPVLERTYRTFGVDRQGNLVRLGPDGTLVRVIAEPSTRQAATNPQPRPPVLCSHVQILESQVEQENLPPGLLREQTSTAAPAATAAGSDEPQVDDPTEIAVFYRDLFRELRARHPGRRPAEIAREIADFDRPLGELRADAAASGLALNEFVGFYQTVDRHFKQGSDRSPDAVEGELDGFLEAAEITPAQLLSEIKEAGWSWNRLLRRMSSTGTSFEELFDGYANSDKDLDDYLENLRLGEYAAGSLETAAAAAVNPVDAAKVAVEAGKLGLNVAKFAWEVIKDGRPKTSAEGAYTSVLSVRDPSFENYANSIPGSSRSVEWEGRNLFTMRVIYVKCRLDGYYGATHPTIGGRWLPSVAFKVDESYAFWGFTLNVGATITSAANRGSAAAPEPEIQAVAQLQANGWFQSFTNSITFVANGATGFNVGS